MREFVSVNTDGVKTSRRCPGEPASPGFLVLCLLLFFFERFKPAPDEFYRCFRAGLVTVFKTEIFNSLSNNTH